MSSKFLMIDEEFECESCGYSVKKLNYSARDHCPQCLKSLHVDIYPGDRSAACRGILVPIGIEKAKKGYKIVYKCSKCGQIKKNIVAKDDNNDLILKLFSKPLSY